MPWALNTGTCLRQGDLFHSAGLHRNHVLATTNTGKIRRGFGKNAGEWPGKVEKKQSDLLDKSDMARRRKSATAARFGITKGEVGRLVAEDREPGNFRDLPRSGRPKVTA